MMNFEQGVGKPKMRSTKKYDGNNNLWGEGTTKPLPHFDMFVEIFTENFEFSEQQQTANYLGIVYNHQGFRLKTPATIYIGYEIEDIKLVDLVRANILATCPNASVIHIETPHILRWAEGKSDWATVFQIKSPARKGIDTGVVFNWEKTTKLLS